MAGGTAWDGRDGVASVPSPMLLFILVGGVV